MEGPSRDYRLGHAEGYGPLQVAAEELEDEQEVFDRIDAFIDDMRVRRAANAQILAGEDPGAGEEGEW